MNYLSVNHKSTIYLLINVSIVLLCGFMIHLWVYSPYNSDCVMICSYYLLLRDFWDPLKLRLYMSVDLNIIFNNHYLHTIWGFPGGSSSKEFAGNAEDTYLIPGSGSYPREGNSNPLQYSCLGNPMDRGAWWATVHGVAKSQTWLNN